MHIARVLPRNQSGKTPILWNLNLNPSLFIMCATDSSTFDSPHACSESGIRPFIAVHDAAHDSAADGRKQKCKSILKCRKKWIRSISAVINEGVELSVEPTYTALIGNGGVTCGLTEDLLRSSFCAFNVLEVRMQRNSPYSFVKFRSKSDCEAAMKSVQCRKPDILPKSFAPFYLAFVEGFPIAEFDLEQPSTSVPKGLTVHENFVTSEQEHALWELVAQLEKQDRGDGDKSVLKNRKVYHFGYEFNYDTNHADKPAPPMPDILHDIADVITRQFGLGRKPDQVTVNVYKPGQGIPAHVDTHSAFENYVASLSIGSQVVIDFTDPASNPRSATPVLVPARSLMLMLDEARYVFEHGIACRKFDLDPTDSSTVLERRKRVSFTFRAVRNEKCRCYFPKYCDWDRTSSGENDLKTPSKLEERMVHDVYNQIASHFHETRHTPWPGVVQFLQSSPPFSAVLDVGCGNGKYLDAVQHLLMFGSDRSLNLCSIAVQRSCLVLQADCLQLPFRDCAFDAVICIAVVHHLATKERRAKSISEMARVLRPGGRALVYVWAFEQRLKGERSAYLKKQETKNRPTAAGSDDSISDGKCSTSLETGPLLSDPKCEKDSRNLSSSAVQQRCDIFDKATEPEIPDFAQLPIHKPRTEFVSQDVLVPWTTGNRTVHRFYHVFKAGELTELCEDVDEFVVEREYYEQGNWCVVLSK